MRLHVEMATASSISSWATSSVMKRVAARSVKRQALAQRHRRGVVRDAEDEQLHQVPTVSRSRSSMRSSASSSSSDSSRSKRDSLADMITT